MVGAVRVKEHSKVPEHGPDHPTNVDPTETVTYNEITVPYGKLAVQMSPQTIPLVQSVGEVVMKRAP